MPDREDLFSIGRTARLFRVSVSSLRHYEAIGLLHPARCARLLFTGSHQEASDQYRKLMAWLKEKKLRPSGYAREVTLIDAGLSGNPEEYVTEIRIPVE